jgi:rubredoxin
VYEGFRKTGERFVCLACGHVYSDESSVPWKGAKRPPIFDESDKSARPGIFSSDDRARNCRHCKHYLVNPFTQRCGLHNRPVEATDVCERFEPKPDPDAV